jgi:hypothetical protein
MTETDSRRYRAGQSIEDLCRVCKIERVHTVIAADAAGHPIRVSCDYCGSEHNYRGVRPTPAALRSSSPASSTSLSGRERDDEVERVATRADLEPFPFVSPRERIAPPVSADTLSSGSSSSSSDSSSDSVDLEWLLRRIIREESGLTVVAPAARWRGGQLVLRPGKADLQEKSWPIETFFHKIVMLRNRLRTLEQQINSADLPEDVKVRLQAYITGCYGSLTSFNVLFADEQDQFKGGGAE